MYLVTRAMRTRPAIKAAGRIIAMTVKGTWNFPDPVAA
jgi:hypothetical protein